jgi:hypothetical protein
MLTARAADAGGVIHRALVLVAFVSCGLVFASFAMFARDQMAGASQQQASATLGPPAGQAGQVAPKKPKQRGEPGRFIVAAANDLTSPFKSIVQSSSAWVAHGVPTFLALMVYGVGLGYLARFSSGFA